MELFTDADTNQELISAEHTQQQMRKKAIDLQIQRDELLARRLVDKEDEALQRRDEDEQSNTLSTLGNAVTAQQAGKEALSVAAWPLRLAQLAASFTVADLSILANPPKCNDNCDNCLRHKIASAYIVDPAKMSQLIGGTGVNTAPRIVVPGTAAATAPTLTEAQVAAVELGKRQKTLLDIYRAKNALDTNPQDPCLDASRYPWKIVGIIRPEDRPQLQPITRRPKEKFGEVCNKSIINTLNARLVPLVLGGRLVSAHFTVIPDLDYKKLTEEARLKAWHNVPRKWQQFYDILEADESVVFAWVNCEVHPATKAGQKGKKETQKTQEELEQEAEEDKVRDGADGDAEQEALLEVPHDADAVQRRQIESANAVTLAKRDRKKKAELAQKICEAIKAIDEELIPLMERKERGDTLSKDQNDRIKQLDRERHKLEAARPNVLAGFPHFEMFVVRDVRLVQASARISTFYYVQQLIQRTGAADTVVKRITKKKSTKASLEHDLTFQARYPLIGHNCGCALANMKAAGYIVDGHRGMTWMYYRKEHDFLDEVWHAHFRNLVVEVQRYDGISLSDDADTWEVDSNLPALAEEAVGEEELLIERVATYMRREGLYLYVDNLHILRRKPGSELSAELAYQNLNDFYRKLTTVPTLKRDLLKKMNLLDPRLLPRYGDLPRVDLCFDAVELKDGFFALSSLHPSKWHRATADGFAVKGKTFTAKKGGVEEKFTAAQLVRKFVMESQDKLLWFCDLNMTMEQMRAPPTAWLGSLNRYLPPRSKIVLNYKGQEVEDDRDYEAIMDRMQHIKTAIADRERQLHELERQAPPEKKSNNKKAKLGEEETNTGSKTVWARMNAAKAKELKDEIYKLESQYRDVHVWTRPETAAFFEACMRLLFVPTARQQNLFLVGKKGSGKTIALCWIHGHTSHTKVIENVEETDGLYPDMCVATLGGNFSLSGIQPGVTRMCLIHEMTPSRTRLDALLTFTEHGQIETERKYSNREHAHAGFSKAFTGNHRLKIKNDAEVTEALEDRMLYYDFNKYVPHDQRDGALESKIRKQKFQIVHWLVTRRWDKEVCEKLWKCEFLAQSK